MMPIHIGGGEFNLDIPALKLWQYNKVPIIINSNFAEFLVNQF